ncbi:MAG: sensor histidine kinase, partial [Terriglobia bacterium]
SNLVAMALEKLRAQETANRAEAARQSEELKSTLLEGITHEFKTPLTSLKAATSMLRSGSENQLQEFREVVTIADEEVDRLTTLLNGAIQTARIESGKLRLNRELHAAAALISMAIQQMTLLVADRELRVLAADPLPFVFVDSELMELAIRQVIGNGLKYSPAATPLTVAARADGASVAISVIDQGPGIPEDEQDRIFEKFYRGAHNRRQVTGAGMGLAIARDILRAHGGDLRVKTAPGQGSEFLLSIPAAAEGGNA